jgi:DUF4097 and DUF4098 domain-containing protein YvlB
VNNVNEIIIERLEEIFGLVECTPETVDLYDEVFMNLKEVCSDYIESGLSEELAIEKAFAELGDLTQLLNDLSSPKINENEGVQSFNSIDNEGYNYQGEEDYNQSPFPKILAGIFLQRKELVNHVTIPMESIDNISITYNEDKVEVVPSNNDSIHVYEYMNIRDSRLFAKWQVVDNTLSIKSGQRPLFSIGVNGLSVKTVICVPRTYHNNMKVEITSGSIKIEELANLQLLETKATSGSQKVINLNVDQMKMSGTSGSISLKEVISNSFKGESTSGTIQVKSGKIDKIKASSTSGSIKIDETTILKSLDLEATSGTIKIVDSNTNEMKLRTTSGSIKGIVSNVNGIFKSKSGSIKLVTPKLDGAVDLSTTSGSISLQLKEEQSFSFKLRFASGSGKVKLPETNINVQRSHGLEGFVKEPSEILISGETLSGSIAIKEA